MNAFYPVVAERSEFRCEYCRAPERIFNFTFEVDHIHPRAKGGETTPSNLALSCGYCNLFKSDMTHVYDDVENKTLLFFIRVETPGERIFSAKLSPVRSLEGPQQDGSP